MLDAETDAEMRVDLRARVRVLPPSVRNVPFRLSRTSQRVVSPSTAIGHRVVTGFWYESVPCATRRPPIPEAPTIAGMHVRLLVLPAGSHPALANPLVRMRPPRACPGSPPQPTVTPVYVEDGLLVGAARAATGVAPRNPNMSIFRTTAIVGDEVETAR